MKNSSAHQMISLLPTGQNTYPPVSVGELPLHDYQASIETTTEEVSSHLEANPDIPGVILTRNGKIHGIIPRNKMFERLGHRYGVELFLRKPIIELYENLGTIVFNISSNTRITAATNIALGRKAKYIYDPLVIEYEDGCFRQLDMHVLLMAQSQVMENITNIISSMNRIERFIKADIPLDTSLDMVIDSIKRTTPYHHVAILIQPGQWFATSSHYSLFHTLSEPIVNHPLIKKILETGNYIHIENTRLNPQWKGMEVIGKTNVWLGIPIKNGTKIDGILSLGRVTNTPFNENEIDMARTFSEFLAVAIHKNAANYENEQFENMIKRKFIYP